MLMKMRFTTGTGKISASEALRRPECRIEQFMPSLPEELRQGLTDEEKRSVETEIKYEGYLKQQLAEVEKMKRAESRKIPLDLDYKRIAGLSREMIEKLTQVKPMTIGQAGRIPGVTPAALTIIHIQLEINNRNKKDVSLRKE